MRLTIPRPLLIEGVEISTGGAYRTGGSTADIYLGQFEGNTVAVKVPRITQVNRIEVIQVRVVLDASNKQKLDSLFIRILSTKLWSWIV